MDIKPPTKQSGPPPPAAIGLNLDLPEPSLKPPPKKKSRRWLWVLVAAASVVVVAIACAVAAFLWYNDALLPKSASTTTQSIQIQSGATVDQVAAELQQKGVIKSSAAFVLYMKFNNKATIKTGTYLFAPDQPVSEIVSWLNDGRVGTRKVTILPGQTLAEIKQSLIKEGGFTEADVTAAFAKTYAHALLAEKPANANLEGYIFPDTYFVESDSTADQLLIRTFDEFEKKVDDGGLRQKLSAHGFNLYQGMALASIVAKEVSGVQDQRQVAQVFEARLSKGMVLGSDVTYHYAASLLGVEPSPDIDSPYNTHKYAGLPPGPIANFNLSALEAVADPAPGDYLYFVAGDDGKTYFATTYDQHVQNIKRYCVKLCASN